MVEVFSSVPGKQKVLKKVKYYYISLYESRCAEVGDRLFVWALYRILISKVSFRKMTFRALGVGEDSLVHLRVGPGGRNRGRPPGDAP